MDRNLHTDDFERLLREKSDEFRMYPSKRIWYSIYNNIHPGKRWPSVVMSLLLLIGLVMVGYLNTNEPNLQVASIKNTLVFNSYKSSFDNQPFGFYNNKSDNEGEFSFSPVALKAESIRITDITKAMVNTKPLPIASSNIASRFKSNTSIIEETVKLARIGSVTMAKSKVSFKKILHDKDFANQNVDRVPALNVTAEILSFSNGAISNIDRDEIKAASESKLMKSASPDFSGLLASKMLTGVSQDITTAAENINNLIAIPGLNTKASGFVFSLEESKWIENYAMYNKPAPKTWAGKLAWELYATPSVVYRTLTTGRDFSMAGVPVQYPRPLEDINKVVIQKPSFGFELGTGFQYPIFKGVRFKAGIQANFTRFNTMAYRNSHPVSTTLRMNDYAQNTTYELFRSTPFSNKTGLDAVKLHNQTLQLSLPVGVDFKLLGNEILQWNIGVTMQPTYVIACKSYLLSADNRNYVKENSMLNRWNLNAGFETFISYKAASGITYAVGPEFRTQLFSTNTKNYVIQEKLMTYGVKFGVIKTLK